MRMTNTRLPDGVADILPLSPVQEGMLFEVLSAPSAKGRYLSVQDIALEGSMDAEAFARIFAEEALRADVSRAAFVHEGVARPLQVVQSAPKLTMPILDFSGDGDVSARLQARIDALSAEDFDLTQAPLMRAELIRTGPAHHRLIWVMHHIISDGWSCRVVLEHALARVNGGAEPAATPSFREHLTRIAARDTTADQAFFAQYLDGFDPDGAGLFPDAPPGADRFETVTRRLPEAATAALRSVAQAERATLATALCLAWGLCLRRYTGRGDVMFGRVSAGRDPNVPGLDRAMGPYLSVSPVRLQLEADMPLRTALARAEANIAALRPFEGASLADALPDGRARLPFDTLLSIQDFALPQAAGSVRVADMSVRDATGFPLALLLRPGPAIEVEAVYDPTRVSRAMAEDVLIAYLMMLETLGAAPRTLTANAPGLKLPPVSPAPPATDAMVMPRAIAAMAAARPEAIALRCGADALSYGDLHARACGLAGTLRAAGVGPGQVVPVLATRSVMTPVAMLAVHYAGAAYAPIDPDYPEARNRAILETLAPACILGEADLPAWSGLRIDPADPAADPASASAEPAPIEASDMAYVIFTSGSTGTPKGVRVSHGNLAWSTHARDGAYGAAPSAFLHLSSFAFDSAVVGHYWTLAHGGTLVIAPARAEQDPGALLALAETEGVSHMLCLPRLWDTVLAIAPAPRSLKSVIVAGEAVPEGLPARHRAAAPHARLFNEYGPTEGSVWCAYADITDARGPVSIGQAPDGAALDVCDCDGYLMPAGLEGELVLRGAGVAQGYLQAEIGDGGFRNLPERSYRTGDRGRLRADGRLDCLGRMDQQVKLRGFRIELAEIEAAALRAGAGAALAAVAGDRIVLAVTDRPEGLHDHLHQNLPPAFHPQAIHELAELPRLPNGKADRKAVAAMGSADAGSVSAPLGHIDQVLAGIWSGLLGVEVGQNTHFFEAGGNSLMTIRALAAADDRGLALRPSDLFDHPVLGDLAGVIEHRLAQPLEGATDRLFSVSNPDGARHPVLMMHGSAEFNASLSGMLGPNRPCLFNWSHHLVGGARLGDGIEVLAEQAIAALADQYPDDPVVVMGYSLGGVIAQEVATRLTAAGRKVLTLVLIDPTARLSPPRGMSEPLGRRIGRYLRAGLSAGLVRAGMAGDSVRHTSHVYRFSTVAHRPSVYEGNTLVLFTELTAFERAARDQALPHATVSQLPYTHIQLLDDRAAIASVVSQISAHIRATEKETGS